MKRALIFILVLATLSSCATVWKTLGVATVTSVDARIVELQKTIDILSAKTDDARKAAENVVRLEALVRELQGQMDNLPAETLQKIADILSKAAAEARSASGAASPAPAAAPVPAAQ
ncbi:MAG: hypothetical protein NT080_10735 [Spirochaetes bacterium]|nr:hypothetical protein [Spirochaetota bacterium]